MTSKQLRTGFTIVELLTVMSVIIILMSVLVPGLTRVRRFARVVTQKGQFNEIAKGLELYRNDHQEAYPDSGATDGNSNGGPFGYCGAMKLCEALIGRDGMGNHPSSSFQAKQSGTYLFDLCTQINPGNYTDILKANLRERSKYTDSENIKAYRLQDVYTWDITSGASFYTSSATFQSTSADTPNAVIGDVFQRADIKGGTDRCPTRAGQKVGMPVLYYKADPSKLNHETTICPSGTQNENIYNFDDNYAITKLGCPWESGRTTEHPMSLTCALPGTPGPLLFYRAITNDKVTSTPRPHNEDGYILLSAGWDGLYGTQDDVYNFSK
jgi:type II secretory pathway pseudopilin PulG